MAVQQIDRAMPWIVGSRKRPSRARWEQSRPGTAKWVEGCIWEVGSRTPRLQI